MCFYMYTHMHTHICMLLNWKIKNFLSLWTWKPKYRLENIFAICRKKEQWQNPNQGSLLVGRNRNPLKLAQIEVTQQSKNKQANKTPKTKTKNNKKSLHSKVFSQPQSDSIWEVRIKDPWCLMGQKASLTCMPLSVSHSLLTGPNMASSVDQ